MRNWRQWSSGCTPGAQVVLVDGALDRVAAASPFVTDAVILSTGAEAGADLSVVAGTAASIVGLWSLKTPNDPEVLALASKAIDEGCVAFLERFTPTVEATVEAPGDPPSCWTLRRTAFSTVLGREEEVLREAGWHRMWSCPAVSEVSQRPVAEAGSAEVAPGTAAYRQRLDRLFVGGSGPRTRRGMGPWHHREPCVKRSLVRAAEMVVYREVFRKTGKRIPVLTLSRVRKAVGRCVKWPWGNTFFAGESHSTGFSDI